MRFALLTALGIFLIANLAISNFDFFSWFWFSTPVLIAFFIELARLKKYRVSRAIPITIFVLYPLGFLVFLSEFYSTTLGAQSGLATAMVPIYQLIIVFLILAAGLIKNVITNSKNKIT
jgi:hypothetical protein